MRPSTRVKELQHALSVWTPDAQPAMAWLLPELRDLLDASFVGAYRPVATDQGWAIDFMHGAGPAAASQVRAFRQWVAGLRPSETFFAYNSYRVDVAQRNRALLLRDLPQNVVVEFRKPVYSAVGLLGHDQVRVLVCEGPRLLSWVGATRTEPFTQREVAIVRHLIRPLQQRLRLERQLRPAWPAPVALEIALGALLTPAFLVGPGDTVEVANRAGVALLDRDTTGVLASIRQSERRPAGGAYTVTKLTAPGWPAYVLAIAKDRRPTASTLASLAQYRWGLTPRQTHVLEWILGGATNKEIALRSSCAEVTVETHVTELYRRSGARSRTDLVRRVFMLGSS